MTYQSVVILLDFFTSRNRIEIVSEGRKDPNAKHGIPSKMEARQDLIDYLDQKDIGPVDLRRVFYRFEHRPSRNLIAKSFKAFTCESLS